LRSLFRKKQVKQELDEELRGFMEMAAEEKVKQGMSRKDALRAVRLERGVSKLRGKSFALTAGNLCRDVVAGFALRRPHAPQESGFHRGSVLTLAFGIGANTAIFGVVNAVLLRPLPFKRPSRLMMLFEGIRSWVFRRWVFGARLCGL